MSWTEASSMATVSPGGGAGRRGKAWTHGVAGDIQVRQPPSVSDMALRGTDVKEPLRADSSCWHIGTVL